MSDRRIHWRCFHCNEGFTKAQERWAREHFGADQSADPVCLMRVPGESSLLTALRNAQAQLASYREDDSDLMRALYAQSADHGAALRNAEEAGYSRGLADGRAEGVIDQLERSEHWWLLGKGRAREDEPLYGLMLIRQGGQEIIAKAEDENLAETVRLALNEAACG